LLRVGQCAGAIQQRRTQLVESRERELNLRFDPRQGFHAKVRRFRYLSKMFKQGGLADARLTTHHKSPATPGLGASEQLFDLVALRAPPQKLGQVLSPSTTKS
jgi:hypothetical protein